MLIQCVICHLGRTNDIEQQMTPELMNEIGNGYLGLATESLGKVINSILALLKLLV